MPGRDSETARDNGIHTGHDTGRWGGGAAQGDGAAKVDAARRGGEEQRDKTRG